MTRGTPQSVIDAAAAIAKVADRLGAAFARELRAVLAKTERQMPDVLAAIRGTTASTVGAEVAASRQQIRAALREAGFDALAEGAYGPALDPVVKRVLAARLASGLDAALTPAMEMRLEAFGSLYQLDLLAEGDVAARALWRAAVRGVFGGSSRSVILDEIARIVQRTEPQIQTLYDTSVSILGRQVEALQANEAADTRFAFMGPVDEVTRPWCLEHVGRVFTRDAIDQMDNGQIGPVFLTGGGWNCRHTFVELSKASGLSELVGTTKRVPEVQDALDGLRSAA